MCGVCAFVSHARPREREFPKEAAHLISLAWGEKKASKSYTCDARLLCFCFLIPCCFRLAGCWFRVRESHVLRLALRLLSAVGVNLRAEARTAPPLWRSEIIKHGSATTLEREHEKRTGQARRKKQASKKARTPTKRDLAVSLLVHMLCRFSFFFLPRRPLSTDVSQTHKPTHSINHCCINRVGNL